MSNSRFHIASAQAVSLMAAMLLASSVVAGDMVIVGGFRFNTDKEQFETNHGIVIRGTQISSLLDEGADMPTTIAKLKVAKDDYILPGIVDLHAHHNVNLFGRRRRDEHVVNPVLYLANGVTTTFTAGEFNPEEMRAARLRIESGTQIGPRLITSGPYFGHARRGWKRDMSATKIREEVDHWVRLGSGGFKAKLISPEHLRVLVEQAHRHGRTVTGHLESGFRNLVNPQEAIEIGIDRVEHFLGGDTISRKSPAYSTLAEVNTNSREFKAITELYIKNKVYFDATLTAYGYFGDRKEGYDHWTDESRFFTPYIQQLLTERKKPRRINTRFANIYRNKRKTVKAFFDAGGLITLGTDHVSDGEYLPGFSVHRELHTLVLSGIPPSSAIKIATLNGAKAIGLGRRTGSIQVGKAADLMIIRGDPLQDIRRTRTVHTVIHLGRKHDSKQLFASVEGKLGPKDAAEAKRW